MEQTFSSVLSELRHSKGISQRTAAADLHISQALLSHYENGAREPGLNFVCRACDYYGVSADYLLGRTRDANSDVSDHAQFRSFISELRTLVDRAEKYTEGSIR